MQRRKVSVSRRERASSSDCLGACPRDTSPMFVCAGLVLRQTRAWYSKSRYCQRNSRVARLWGLVSALVKVGARLAAPLRTSSLQNLTASTRCISHRTERRSNSWLTTRGFINASSCQTDMHKRAISAHPGQSPLPYVTIKAQWSYCSPTDHATRTEARIGPDPLVTYLYLYHWYFLSHVTESAQLWDPVIVCWSV